MEQRTCAKCKKVLPENYKHDICEACRGKQANNIRNIGGGILAIAGAIISVVVGVKMHGKN